MNRRILMLVLLVIESFTVYGTIKPDILKKVSEYPDSYKRIEDLATKINFDFSENIDKAASIYTWIALNIEYDVKSFFSAKNKSVSYSYRTLEEKAAKEKEIEDNTIKTTLRKRGAVCEGYAVLYKRLCDLCGVECVIVNGRAKTLPSDIGKQPKGSDHAWNAIKINKQWHLLDVTWGSGSVDYKTRKFQKEFNEEYFLLPPERFFYKHFPVDKRWLLVDKDADDFASQPLFWSSYLFSDDELIAPENGIIKTVKKGNIEFKLSTEREIKNLYYAFERDKHSTRLDIHREDKFIYFKVPAQNRRSGYLTIYEGRQPLFTFKLSIK